MRKHQNKGKRRSSAQGIGAALVLVALLVLLTVPAARQAVANVWTSLVLPWAHKIEWPFLPTQPQEANDLQPMEWDETTAPNYYLVVGPAHFVLMPSIGTVQYTPLDWLGRAGKASACINADLSAYGTNRERKDMQNVEPSGWGYNEEADIELPTGGVYHGYFWNRSHLLAKSLGGDEVEENLVCGTRMQNVGTNLNGTEGGMAYCEALVRNWLERNPEGYVLYDATPVYQANELVCRNVVVNIYASDGSIDQEVVVFNAAKGYDIDYATGQFAKLP